MTGHRIRTQALLGAAPLAAVLLAAAPPAHSAAPGAPPVAPARFEITSFSTPSGNIRCAAVKSSGKWSLRCDTLDHDWQPPSLDCSDFGDNAASVAMGKRKRPRFICVSDAVGPGRVLGYGRVWDKGPFTCTSRRKGLRCYNLGGHGWSLSRESYRLF
jgi:hypothetical protein